MKRLSSTMVTTVVLAFGVFLVSPGWADEIDDLIKKISSADYGQEAESFDKLGAKVIESHSHVGVRKDLAARFAAILDDPKATGAAKVFACRELYRIGTKKNVPTLAKLLISDETADMARYALERMPCAEAGEALRAALEKTKGTTKVGIINSLGARRDTAALAMLGPLVGDANRAIAEAAIVAVGRIGGHDAAELLTEAKRRAARSTPERIAAFDEALLMCASDLAANNDAKAEAIYKALYDFKEASGTRAAALKALAAIRPDGAVSLILAALERDDAMVSGAASDAAREIKTDKATEQLARALRGLKPSAQALVISALADRGDRKALSAVTSAAGSKEASVRLAALDALGVLGDASTAMMLAKLAAGGEGEEAGVARRSLDRLKGKDVDAVLTTAAAKGDAKLRTEVIRSLAARGAFSALPTLWATAGDSDPAVRAESFKSLGVLASAKDLPQLLTLLTNEKTDGPRDQAEAAVLSIAGRIRRPKEQVAATVAAFPTTENNVPARCALVRILGRLQGDEALEPIRASVKSPDPKVREVAIRALAEWKPAAPLADLYDLAQKEAPGELGRVALRAYFRLLALPGDRPTAETVGMYEKGLALARHIDEKKQAIAALADVADKRAIEVVKRLQADKDLKADADAAIQKITHRSRRATASLGEANAKNAIDGNPDTRWDTGAKQEKGQWFQLDLGWECEVRKIVLDTTKSASDYPRGYEVFVSNSTESWGDPVAKGEGKGPVTEIDCRAKKGRYIRIVQTGSTGNEFWSIHEMKVETAD